MSQLQKWIFGLAGTAIAVIICFEWLDRPIAVLFKRTITHAEPFVELTHLPDPFLPLAVVIFIALGLWNLSGRVLSRTQNCALLRRRTAPVERERGEMRMRRAANGIGREHHHEIDAEAFPVDAAQIGDLRGDVAAENIDRDRIADLEA